MQVLQLRSVRLSGSSPDSLHESASYGCAAENNLRDAGRQKHHVPQKMIAVLINVVKPQDLVVDKPFHKIEQTPSKDQGAAERFP